MNISLSVVVSASVVVDINPIVFPRSDSIFWVKHASHSPELEEDGDCAIVRQPAEKGN